MQNEECRISEYLLRKWIYLKLEGCFGGSRTDGAGHFNFYKGSPYGRALPFVLRRAVRGYTAARTARGVGFRADIESAPTEEIDVQAVAARTA